MISQSRCGAKIVGGAVRVVEAQDVKAMAEARGMYYHKKAGFAALSRCRLALCIF